MKNFKIIKMLILTAFVLLGTCSFSQRPVPTKIRDVVTSIEKYIRANHFLSIADLKKEIAYKYKKSSLTFSRSEYLELIKADPELRFFISQKGSSGRKYIFRPSSVVLFKASESILDKSLNKNWILNGGSLSVVQNISDDFLEEWKSHKQNLQNAKSSALSSTLFRTLAISTALSYPTALFPAIINGALNGTNLIDGSVVSVGLFLSFVVYPIIYSKNIKNVYDSRLLSNLSADALRSRWANAEEIPWLTGAVKELSQNGFNLVTRDANKAAFYLINENLEFKITFFKNQFKLRLANRSTEISFTDLKKSYKQLSKFINTVVKDCNIQFLK